MDLADLVLAELSTYSAAQVVINVAVGIFYSENSLFGPVFTVMFMGSGSGLFRNKRVHNQNAENDYQGMGDTL